MAEAAPQGAWRRLAGTTKTLFRILFGVVWIFAGYFKFAPGFVDQFSVPNGDGQPFWLQGWFNWWAGTVNPDPAPWVYLTGSIEILIGLALVFGFMRKLAYSGAAVLSLFIWAVPEGFGGPYGGGTNTDIGTGFVYSMLCLSLLIINGAYGPSRLSLDYYIEQYWPKWAIIAEVKMEPAEGARVPPAGPPKSSPTTA